MSYSRHYQTSVSYSGSVHYSYPASQNGGSGSASYSGSIPVSITINVNTQPFDGSVNNFNNSVNILSGSVVAMNAAQCAAIQQTANEVSNSIINGFFGTIKTELSQQIQALDSGIKARLGLLMQQNKAVTDIKNIMESDYNRITSRYVRLFADLDSECYKRIYALDKQSFALSEKVQKELLCESSSNTAALNLLGIEEISTSKILVFISSLNRKALEVLKTLHNYITQESRINILVNSFLYNDEIEEKIPMYIPVVWIESDMLEGSQICHESYIPDYYNRRRKSASVSSVDDVAIAEKVSFFCSEASEWKAVEEADKETLNREFNTLAESFYANLDSETEQRVYKTMLSLWHNSNLFSL